jgi:hypothetical protein
VGLIPGHVKPMTIKMNASLRNKNKDWLAWENIVIKYLLNNYNEYDYG